MTDKLAAWFRPHKHQISEKQAIVIGGGIAGSQIAWHLAERDWQVTVIERHASLATEASGNKAGVVSPKMTAKPSLGENFYTACFRYITQQLKTLEKQNYSFTWDACGVLQINHNQRELARWQSLKQRNFSDDFLQCVSAEEASELSGIELKLGASYFPTGAWLNPQSFCNALCSHKNIKLILNTSALKLDFKDKKWRIKSHSNNKILTAPTVIIANGKDALQFQQTQHLSMLPILGQTSEAIASSYSQQLKTVIGHEGYLTPNIQGKHIFGATFERNQTHAKFNSNADAINYQQLKKHLPKLANSLSTITSSHAAIRMVTPDRFPYVGAIPDRQFYMQHYADISKGKHWKNYPDAQYLNGLFIFAGHASRGLTTTGLTAKYLASWINNEPFSEFSNQIKSSLHPARFDIRYLKKL